MVIIKSFIFKAVSFAKHLQIFLFFCAEPLTIQNVNEQAVRKKTVDRQVFFLFEFQTQHTESSWQLLKAEQH